MTITSFSQSRGTKNWAKRTGGLEDKVNEIITDLNSLVLSGITASTFFSANVQSSGSNITLTSLANLQFITMTNSGLYLRLPSASSAFFDGGVVFVKNEGGTYSFDIQDNSGSVLVDDLAIGQTAVLTCKTDGTAAGTWSVLIIPAYVAAGVSSLLDTILTRASFRDCSERAYSVGNVSGAVTLDYTNGHWQYMTLTGNITSLTINNPPASGEGGFLRLEMIQDGTGSRTLTYNTGTYKEVGGAAVVLTTTASATDEVYLWTRDGGTTWRISANLDFK